jgi:hypothetical protein
MKGPARLVAGAALAAGVLHAAAGNALAARDPIAALLGPSDGLAAVVVVVAAAGVAVARLFLYFVAPAWAAHVAITALAGAITRARGPR